MDYAFIVNMKLGLAVMYKWAKIYTSFLLIMWNMFILTSLKPEKVKVENGIIPEFLNIND